MALKDSFNKLKDNVTTAGQNAAHKAKKTADIVQMREQIRRDKRDIKNVTCKIGKTYIRLHKDDFEDAYKEYFEELRIIQDALDLKEQKLEQMIAERKAGGGDADDVDVEDDSDDDFDDDDDIDDDE